MSTTNQNHDIGSLEEHADSKRSEISQTLEELEQKLSPGQLVDQAATLFRDQGGPMARNLATSARDNPLPLLLTGVGLAWLMASQSGSTADRRRYRASMSSYDDYDGYDDFDEDYADDDDVQGDGYRDDYYDDDIESGRGTPMGSADRASVPAATTGALETNDDRDRTLGATSELSDVGTDRREGFDTARRPVEDDDGHDESTMNAIGRKAGDLGDTVRRKRRRAGRDARRRAARMREGGRRHAQNLGEQAGSMARQMQSYFEREPLVAGAVGVAVGAVIGSLIPSTRVEDRHMGEPSDTVTNETAARAESAMQDARQKVEHAGQTAREAAEQRVRRDVHPSSSAQTSAASASPSTVGERETSDA